MGGGAGEAMRVNTRAWGEPAWRGESVHGEADLICCLPVSYVCV